MGGRVGEGGGRGGLCIKPIYTLAEKKKKIKADRDRIPADFVTAVTDQKGRIKQGR